MPDPWDGNDGQTQQAESCPNTEPHRSHEWGADEFHPNMEAWCPGVAAVSVSRGVTVYTSGGAIGYGDPPGRGATGDDQMRHIMYPVALAEARERVIEAARIHQATEPGSDARWKARGELNDALAALDALEAPDTEGGS